MSHDDGAMYFYARYCIVSKGTSYARRRFPSCEAFLIALDRWNAAGVGYWQYYSVYPGYGCPRYDPSDGKYIDTGVE